LKLRCKSKYKRKKKRHRNRTDKKSDKPPNGGRFYNRPDRTAKFTLKTIRGGFGCFAFWRKLNKPRIRAPPLQSNFIHKNLIGRNGLEKFIFQNFWFGLKV